MSTVNIFLNGSAPPGTYFVEDDGDPANGLFQLRSPDGSIVVIAIPTDSLSVSSVPGRSVVFNLTEWVATSNITVGSLTDSTQNPDFIQVDNITGANVITLVSNGVIAEFGADFATDIVSNSLILSAATGIGTAAAALETQVAAIEAETNTGGIALTNYGNVAIGALVAEVDGLNVETSGNIAFTNFGTITFQQANPTLFLSAVSGGNTSGNVTLVASGFDSDITSAVNFDSVEAPRGNISLTAGRDISLGTGGFNFDNDVRASGSITINAGRDFIATGDADIVADNFGLETGGNLAINAGRDVSNLNNGGGSTIGTGGGAGGDTLITTGFGGVLTLAAANVNALFSSSGDVIVRADRILIDAASGISAPASGHGVTLNAASDGREIYLGSVADAAAAVELSDAELDRIFTPNVFVGTNDTGTVSVLSALDPANVANVELRSGTDIFVRASMTVTTSLTLRGGNNVYLTPSTINVPTFAAFADTVGNDAGQGGIINVNALVAATTATLTGNAENDTLTGTSAVEKLFGLAGNDTLRGNGGNDTLNGGTGVDSMSGGVGNDTYFVDNAGDQTIEAAGEGNDAVYTSVNYALAAGTSIDSLSAQTFSSTAPINLTGNELDQSIYGNIGDNQLTGGGGLDFMSGFAGNDTYFVDSLNDVIVESVGQGTDAVVTSVSYGLTSGAEIESFSAQFPAATTPINLLGNTFNQSIFGNAGANIIRGGGGTDQMTGFGGNDRYYVDSLGDTVIEAVGGGNDTVYASSNYTLGAGQEIETLTTEFPTGTTAINLTGNEFGQTITGNAGGSLIDGKGGNDVLQGLGGADGFSFTTALGPGNVDTIADMVSGSDKIRLFHTIFGGLPTGALSANAFFTGAAAHDADDRIIYNGATGALFFDADGTGPTAQVQFATVTGHPVLAVGDFFVI